MPSPAISAAARALRVRRKDYTATPAVLANLDRARLVWCATVLANAGYVDHSLTDRVRADVYPGLTERRALAAQAGLTPAPKL